MNDQISIRSLKIEKYVINPKPRAFSNMNVDLSSENEGKARILPRRLLEGMLRTIQVYHGLPLFKGSFSAKRNTDLKHRKIWRFPEIGEPPVIIHFWLGFSTMHHLFWGIPIYGNLHWLVVSTPLKNISQLG